MSFPRYPKYKDSGVEWLGEVPCDWSVRRLKHVCSVSPSNVDKKTYEDEHAVKLCNYTDVYYNDTIGPEIDFMQATASDEQIARFELKTGDIIITKDSETADDIAISAFVPDDLAGVVCGYHLALIRPSQAIVGKYVKRLFDSRYLKGRFAVAANGLTRVGLSQYALDNVEIPVPPESEQTTIVTFLDRETGKIDALVAEQEKLIALLKEKRQAVISHAVTKGLNPDVQMKPSGIEWLGDVPAHWDVMPMKRDLAFITSGSRGWAEYYADDGELFIRIGNLTRETLALDLTDIQRVTVPVGSEGERTIVRPGDLLFSITAYLGSVAVAPDDCESAYVSQHVSLARLAGRKFIPRWVGYIVLSALGKTYLDMQAYGGTKIQLSLDDVANLVCTAPDQHEQKSILNYLDRQILNFDRLVREAGEAVTLLKERRSTLISAAVTGQIDVRNAAPAVEFDPPRLRDGLLRPVNLC